MLNKKHKGQGSKYPPANKMLFNMNASCVVFFSTINGLLDTDKISRKCTNSETFISKMSFETFVAHHDPTFDFSLWPNHYIRIFFLTYFNHTQNKFKLISFLELP